MLNEDEKNTCREIAREIIKEVIKEHIESCPHGKTIIASKMFLTGMCVGSGFAGGSLVLAVAKFIFGFAGK